MFTAEQYRAKAAEYSAFLANSPRSPNETSEFHNLAQTYTTLAENEEWMAVHLDRTVQRRKPGDDGAVLSEVEEQILRCLGGAVMMRWNTVPTKLQKELFDCASSVRRFAARSAPQETNSWASCMIIRMSAHRGCAECESCEYENWTGRAAHESVPPRLYGGTERIVSYLTEELVRLGHEVTLFASGDSITGAQLRRLRSDGAPARCQYPRSESLLHADP